MLHVSYIVMYAISFEPLSEYMYKSSKYSKYSKIPFQDRKILFNNLLSPIHDFGFVFLNQTQALILII